VRYTSSINIAVYFLWLVVCCDLAYAELEFPVRVASIRFETQAGLSYEDLSRDLSFHPGDLVSQNDIDRAVTLLKERGVFSSVQVEFQTVDSVVNVVFHLTPKTIVSRVRFSGNPAMDPRTLRRRSRIQQGDYLDGEKIKRAIENVTEEYRKLGFSNASVDVRIEDRGYSSVDVIFDIKEGSQGQIVKIRMPENLPVILSNINKVLASEYLGQPASEQNLKEIRIRSLELARNEGYLQASTDIEKSHVFENGDIEISVNLVPREPLTIVFSGNKRFREEDLLSPLKLSTRSIPFSANIGRRLCRDVIQMYENEGYFFARASCYQGERVGDREYFHVDIDEGVPTQLVELVFEGNEHLSGNELRAVMQTKVAGWWIFGHWQRGILRGEILTEDLTSIEELYRSRGFQNVKTSFSLNRAEDENALSVTINIKEGPRSVLKSVTVRLNGYAKQLVADSGESVVPSDFQDLKPGEPYGLNEIDRAQTELNEHLINNGYPNARVTAQSNFDDGQVQFIITPGERVNIGNIRTEGNLFTHDQVLLRELKLSPGDLFSEERRQQSEQRVSALGLFRAVSLEPSDGAYDSSVENMSLRVVEQETGSLETALAYDTEDGLHLTTELTQRNLNGLGEALIVGFDGYFLGDAVNLFDAGRSRIAYFKPHLFDSDVDMQTEGFVQTAVNLFNEFSYDRIGSSFRLIAKPEQHYRLSAGPLVYLERLFDVDPDVQIGPDDSGTSLYSLLDGEASLDLRDDPYNTRRGTLSNVNLKYASPAIGSDSHFGAVNLSEMLFLPFTEKVVWVSRVGFSMIEPLGGTDVVPISQRIFLGGRSSLRGYARNSVGPRGELNNVIGGDSAWTFSNELQRDISENVVLAAFLDMGSSFLRHKGSFTGDPLSASDIKYSPGVGIRYKTPIGPASLDAALPLSREYGERAIRINFGIGLAY
jgi:outer membrane protein insertion porin family